MSGFADLKKASNKSIDALVAKAETMSGGGAKKSYVDDRFWKPTRDPAGNAYAEIRFLPSAKAADGGAPWIRYWDHGFQGPTGRWYIENSLTSIGQDDPLGELNSKLWKEGEGSEGQAQARKQKRRLHYVSNIMVVRDPQNPENDGKVFLYKYGAKVFDKLMSAMKPEFEDDPDEQPINPFDFWGGATFKLKIRIVEDWPNYDKAGFSDPSPVFDDDAKIEELFNQLHDIDSIIDPSNYKTYAELKTKLNLVLGLENHDVAEDEQPVADYTPHASSESRPREAAAEPELPTAEASGAGVVLNDEEEEEESKGISYFQDMADED